MEKIRFKAIEDVLNKLESYVLKLKEGKDIAVHIKIIHESGATFLEGTASEDGGFNGVSMS